MQLSEKTKVHCLKMLDYGQSERINGKYKYTNLKMIVIENYFSQVSITSCMELLAVVHDKYVIIDKDSIDFLSMPSTLVLSYLATLNLKLRYQITIREVIEVNLIFKGLDLLNSIQTSIQY